LKQIELAERVFGPDHPDFATSLSNAAILYFNLKELDRARDFICSEIVFHSIEMLWTGSSKNQGGS